MSKPYLILICKQDFRCCSGAHSAVFELCYQMYRPLGLIGIALASYFKLVQIFINTMTSNNGIFYPLLYLK